MIHTIVRHKIITTQFIPSYLKIKEFCKVLHQNSGNKTWMAQHGKFEQPCCNLILNFSHVENLQNILPIYPDDLCFISITCPSNSIQCITAIYDLGQFDLLFFKKPLQLLGPTPFFRTLASIQEFTARMLYVNIIYISGVNPPAPNI